MALIPENRMEQILAGENLTPESREEAFVKEAIDNAGSGGGSALPAPGASGNVLTSTGDGWESAAPQSGLPDATGASVGDVVTLGADGAEWDAPQGGDNTYWVDIIYGEPLTTDATCASIVANVAAGKAVLARVDLGEQKLTFVCTSAKADNCIFVGAVDEYSPYIINIADQYGSSRVNMYPRAFVPEGDDGQTLVWDDDRWLAANNPNAPYIVHMELNLGAGTATVTDGKTIADILAVTANNPNVYAEFAFGTGHGRLMLVGWDSNTALGESTVTFSGVSGGAKGILIEGENDGTADTWTVTIET